MPGRRHVAPCPAAAWENVMMREGARMSRPAADSQTEKRCSRRGCSSFAVVIPEGYYEYYGEACVVAYCVKLRASRLEKVCQMRYDQQRWRRSAYSCERARGRDTPWMRVDLVHRDDRIRIITRVSFLGETCVTMRRGDRIHVLDAPVQHKVDKIYGKSNGLWEY